MMLDMNRHGFKPTPLATNTHSLVRQPPVAPLQLSLPRPTEVKAKDGGDNLQSSSLKDCAKPKPQHVAQVQKPKQLSLMSFFKQPKSSSLVQEKTKDTH